MRFKGFDLNLLVALDYLLTEQSVTRAAERLYRNQSTVSAILARLREHFDDDLLVQVGREMVPTARGVELATKVRDLLLRIDATILTASEFDPVASERAVRIFASDYVMIAGLADALRIIQQKAPRLKLTIMQPSQFQRGTESPAALLEKGEIELLVMPQNFMSEAHPRLPLFTETVCGLVSRDNADVGTKVSTADFLQMRHATVGFGPGATPSYEAWFNREFGEDLRHIDIVAGSFTTMPFLLPGTKRIALAHRRLAVAYTKMLPLRIVETEFSIPPLVEAVQWHQYTNTDRALMWVRDQIVDLMSDSAAERQQASIQAEDRQLNEEGEF
ncbi:LysR family transcriptional regulator [uncultured Devosia sp.]|uniref:LysR family transcriptional regulator n=1 Tax=uncultured Devosia sp. TaxID=211434 RepID=UPI002616B99B|nr:LysR family transcriptional regulator [uncultured Devosia sp.]